MVDKGCHSISWSRCAGEAVSAYTVFHVHAFRVSRCGETQRRGGGGDGGGGGGGGGGTRGQASRQGGHQREKGAAVRLTLCC